MDIQKKKVDKKKLAAAGTAVVTAGALVVGGLFAEPAELLEEDAGAVVEAECVEEEAAEERGKRRGLRQRILALPLYIRAGVFLPLWALGWALGSLLPLAARPLGLGAAVLGAAAAAAKLLRPELPLKSFLCRRNIALILLLLGLLWGSDALLPLVCEDYERFQKLLWALLSLSGGAALLLPLKRKEEPIPAETQEEALRRVLEMADEAGQQR